MTEIQDDQLMKEVKTMWTDPRFNSNVERLMAIECIFLREIARKL